MSCSSNYNVSAMSWIPSTPDEPTTSFSCLFYWCTPVNLYTPCLQRWTPSTSRSTSSGLGQMHAGPFSNPLRTGNYPHEPTVRGNTNLTIPCPIPRKITRYFQVISPVIICVVIYRVNRGRTLHHSRAMWTRVWIWIISTPRRNCYLSPMV